MSETEKTETVESLTAEGTQLFKKAGELQYTIEVNKAQLVQTNQKLLEVNTKVHKLLQAAPKEVPPTPPEATV